MIEDPSSFDDSWHSLTAAETRIARRVAEGLSNKAIADRLVLSPHTISAHLRNIYAKLDIHSRVELGVLSIMNPDPAAPF
jgi:DNA-binding CsgD family transcriptional regulator